MKATHNCTYSIDFWGCIQDLMDFSFRAGMKCVRDVMLNWYTEWTATSELLITISLVSTQYHQLQHSIASYNIITPVTTQYH